VAAFLADQNFEDEVAAALQAAGHDVVLARTVGLQRVPDPDLLTAATATGRAVLTHDRDFIRLHRSGGAHAGVVFCSVDTDAAALAARTHAVASSLPSLVGQLVRVNRPAKP
jgi:predicted nuclease of predicted toxin-antitoxin system